MFRLPDAAEPLFTQARVAFTRPTFERFVLMCFGAIITFGRRSVSRILWTLGSAVEGDASSYHRLFSRARWSLWPLARLLASAVLGLISLDQPVLCAVDDTFIEHRGDRVYGTGRHRKAAGSARGTWGWGHRWVVLTVLIKFPFASRCWALPVLCALYRAPKVSAAEKRRHKTPCQLARHLLAILLHWFPDRRFVVLGDGGFASHDLAGFAHRHRRRLTLIARANPGLNLHVLPTPRKPCRQTIWKRRKYKTRPRCRKGRKLASPQKTVAAARAGGSLPSHKLQWYGQSQKVMEIFSACGGWYHAYGNGTAALVPLRWVYTSDPHKPKDQRKCQDWFFCTDPAWNPCRIVETFATRWSIEVTFEELRAHLGLCGTRQRSRQSVLRIVPWLIGLFSVICLIFNKLWQQKSRPLHHTPCYQKHEPTFADALYAVRRSLWESCLLKSVLGPAHNKRLPISARNKLLNYLAEAA